MKDYCVEMVYIDSKAKYHSLVYNVCAKNPGAACVLIRSLFVDEFKDASAFFIKFVSETKEDVNLDWLGK